MTEAPNNIPSRLIDLRLPAPPYVFWRWILRAGVMWLILYLFIWLLNILSLSFGKITALTLIAAILVFAVGWGLSPGSSKRKTKAKLDRYDLDRLPPDLAAKWPELPKTPEPEFFTSLIDRLAEQRRFGETYRLQGYDGFDEIAPIDAPFEPIPIDQPEKAAQTAPPPPTISHKPPWHKRAYQSDWTRQAIMLIILLTLLYNAVINRRFSWWLPILGLGLLHFYIKPFLGQTISRRQYFLVPGGLVVRRTPRFDREWRLSLLDRRNAILLIWSPHYDSNAVWIKTPEETLQIDASHDQTVQLLRAWLSPLDPPALDQLSDLK